ncbi:fungal-specific transcription factor domain-containing protein [Rhexocercosporidium sp. MPI-PUGE-AT-0058]|nr:fungal-specific transcription factor domain-containing protein [Rhexocercosporidium sp. MPI-PUGE-AT-0058]
MPSLLFPRAPSHPTAPIAPVFSSSDVPWSANEWDDAGLWQNLFHPLPAEDLTAPSLSITTSRESVCRKRRRERSSSPFAETAASIWMNEAFPELEPATVLLPARTWAIKVPNPFVNSEAHQHPRLRTPGAPVVLPEDGRIDGLIKVRLNYSKKLDSQPVGRLQAFPVSKPHSIITRLVDSNASQLASNATSDNAISAMEAVRFLPPDFGRGLRLKPMDEKLFNFFLVAICGGVTLIPNGNSYLTEIAPIAARSECVKHAVLALSATYILDYSREDHIRTRANFHWKRAVHLLTEELNNEVYEPGKEDTVVAALVLFSHNENVNWESEQERQEDPAWYRASRLAEQILAKSDPLYRYRYPSNVQCSLARDQLGNKIALYNIMSATMWPLDPNEERCPFVWLLEGEEVDLRKIKGCTGLSPRLVHTFAQITHLSAKLFKDPTRLTAQKLGRAIGERLNNFWQWSELSLGYPTSLDLMNSCILDENGHVSDATKATELLAETYTAAGQIYLYCRLMRKPRNHPIVQQTVRRLLWCLSCLPTSGPLFTGQHAQLRVVIAATVATTVAHRSQIKDWFEGLVQGTRGNVPPVWRAVKYMWDWQDRRFSSSESSDSTFSSDFAVEENSDPWWEEMVGHIFVKEGKLNLA